ncbi:uncharacterized protein Bfra_002436 [Botrytis fragariae]|uniref:Uncharacterized protein n=1 Tax=Botrytis fragariae TaxID=1964551 RepID=A0A8H6AYB6_9HELO|nr:uncharacterized protein Bfra_002436 [Botrytis fragariae]KAF5876038.1 hypothetical protein Bfra_002436 [Botrytis fragariae]
MNLHRQMLVSGGVLEGKDWYVIVLIVMATDRNKRRIEQRNRLLFIRHQGFGLWMRHSRPKRSPTNDPNKGKFIQCGLIDFFGLFGLLAPRKIVVHRGLRGAASHEDHTL